MTAATALPESDIHPMGTKAAILVRAEALFAEAEVPYRAGRMARIVGKKFANGYGAQAWAAVQDELAHAERAAHGYARFQLRDARGVIDPTGQKAAARVDAERAAKKKNAPAGVGAKSRGEVKQLGG